MHTSNAQLRTENDPVADAFPAALSQAAHSVDVGAVFEAAGTAAARMLDLAGAEKRDRFLLSGSGDSLFAAASAGRALRLFSGLDVRVSTSIECARYELPEEAARAVLIAVSNSGGSTRTRETAALAQKLGVPTVGVVGSRDGPLAASADVVLHRPVALQGTTPDWSPRVYLNAAEYMAGLVALYALGLHTGCLRGAMSQEGAVDWRDKIEQGIGDVGAAAQVADPIMRDLARSMDGVDTLWVLGAGPSRGTADYSAAKFHEQVPLNGVSQDLEEWAHLQYFLTLGWGAGAVVLVLAPKGRSTDRAAEILTGIRQAGGRAILVTDDPQLLGQNDAEAVVALPDARDELLSPLTFHVPAQLLALHLARRRSVPEIPLRRTDDRWLIRGGDLRTEFA